MRIVRRTRGDDRQPRDWTFGGRWPYEPRWFDTTDGRLHYIDEGGRDGRPIVLLHGNPTWGFLYRHFVEPLRHAGHRVVVPDFLGFGRSDKPADPNRYRTAEHVRRLTALLDSLDLCGTVLVPQDWGGLGLAWAAARPERLAGLFLLNTTAHPPTDRWKLPLPLRLFRMPGVGEVMVQGLGLFHRSFLFGIGIKNRERLTGPIKKAYWAPHPTWGSRTATLAFPRQIPISPDDPLSHFYRELEGDLRERLDSVPVRIMWAMQDVGFTPSMIDLWLSTFPHADVIRLDGAGHYLQEDAYERIVPSLLDFVSSLPPLPPLAASGR